VVRSGFVREAGIPDVGQGWLGTEPNRTHQDEPAADRRLALGRTKRPGGPVGVVSRALARSLHEGLAHDSHLLLGTRLTERLGLSELGLRLGAALTHVGGEPIGGP